MNAPPRRNDPCPCGSSLRYKECHGRLDDAASTAPLLERLVERALQAHQQGRPDEAARGYREILAREPGHPVATHYLGLIAWHGGDLAAAEGAMRASLATDATVPDFHNNLALLLRDTGRTEEAIAGFRSALAIDPGWAEAHSNLGLALEDARRFDEAEAAYHAALAAAPEFATAHQNLARLLLARAQFVPGWDHYRWRLLAQGFTRQAPAPSSRLEVQLEGRNFVLVAEQGVGDVLFFLRFAPDLVARGARLAFRGDSRLHTLLTRTGLFALGCAEEAVATSGREAIFIGDLPGLLDAFDPEAFPPALALQPDAKQKDTMATRLAACGPAPRVGLTWRSGVASAPGPARTQVKAIAPEALGRALRNLPATWVSVQRAPQPGEREALEEALGAPVHDLSAVNDDLEAALAAQAGLDFYVGTSNANTHLRAGLGATQLVLVPDPPEWRWLATGHASPWFTESRVYRPEGGSWDGALQRLREHLARDLGGG